VVITQVAVEVEVLSKQVILLALVVRVVAEAVIMLQMEITELQILVAVEVALDTVTVKLLMVAQVVQALL
jgi:hypothetical protein